MSDLISRSALLEEVKSLTVTVMGLRAGKGVLYEYAKQYRDTLLRIIDEQPTVEAVPVVEAEWLSTGNEEIDNIYSGYKCSACGYVICGNSGKYCGGCGAMMKGGE